MTHTKKKRPTVNFSSSSLKVSAFGLGLQVGNHMALGVGPAGRGVVGLQRAEFGGVVVVGFGSERDGGARPT